LALEVSHHFVGMYTKACHWLRSNLFYHYIPVQKILEGLGTGTKGRLYRNKQVLN
jgi:hypothetical protein